MSHVVRPCTLPEIEVHGMVLTGGLIHDPFLQNRWFSHVLHCSSAGRQGSFFFDSVVRQTERRNLRRQPQGMWIPRVYIYIYIQTYFLGMFVQVQR